MKKKHYESPDISVTRVELEGAICSGSVEFTGPDASKSVIIDNQGFSSDQKSNDFSDQSWEVSTED